MYALVRHITANHLVAAFAGLAYAYRLKNGHTLIADSGHQRVIEVDSSGLVTWQFGATDAPWVGGEYLNRPTDARRLDNGNTLITDSGNARVIEVNIGKFVVWQYGGSRGCAPG